MLTKEEKKQVVKNLREKLKENKLAVFCNFEGLSSGEQRELKRKFKESEGELSVVKRRLLQKALMEEKLDFPEIIGPVMIGFSKDEILPAKIIFSFKKGLKAGRRAPKLEFIGGIANEKQGYRILTKEELEELAKLPNKEEILISLLNTLKAPILKLDYIFKGNFQKLMYIFANIRE
jgi:large subunit ribosomal protein L10